MKQKNATPNKAQQQILKSNGLSPHLWTVTKELPSSLIIRNRVSGEFKLIEK